MSMGFTELISKTCKLSKSLFYKNKNRKPPEQPPSLSRSVYDQFYNDMICKSD